MITVKNDETGTWIKLSDACLEREEIEASVIRELKPYFKAYVDTIVEAHLYALQVDLQDDLETIQDELLKMKSELGYKRAKRIE